jgi:hypothetical protein
MLSFATEFPVNHDRNAGEFIDAVRSWILGSPHTKFAASDLAIIPATGEWSAQKENEVIHALLTSSPNKNSAAFRLKQISGDLEWLTTIVFSRQEANSWVGVRTSNESNHPTSHLPPAKKPIIVRLLMDKLGEAMDGGLRVLSVPHKLKSEDVGLAARLISGQAGCHLPVVYMSCGFAANYIARADALARDISGMAHLILEPNRVFSRQLQIEADSENVYGGTIGVYWPNGGGRRSFFIGPEFNSPAKIERAIFDEIRIALLNRRPLVRCTWSAVQEIISKEAFKSLEASGSREVEKYIETFDSKMRARDEQLADAETEIFRLEAKIRKHESQVAADTGMMLCEGKEHDLYTGEIREIIRDAIEYAANHVPRDSRREHVLKAVLNALPAAGIERAQRETLKDLLRGYKNMDNKTRKGLENIGFSIEEEGKHYKLVFQDDNRYTFTLPKSGSDHRGGLNAANDISKLLF